MSIAKRLKVEADCAFGVNFDYAVDNGIQDCDVGESFLGQFGQTNMDLDLMIGTSETHKMRMVCASFYVPKDNPDKPLGEDAHFLCEERQTIGVADGVGDRNIDAGDYARALMRNASLSAGNTCNIGRKRKAYDFDTGSIRAVDRVDPFNVLSKAWFRTKENQKLQGSSTACILSFGTDPYIDGGVLHAINVGDSGFMLFGPDNKAFFESPIMQHYFNCPYQMGNHPDYDGPGSAREFVFQGLMPGDTIVLGTDGLFDNLFKEEIEDALERTMKCWKDEHLNDRLYCEMAAEIIAKRALDNSKDPNCDSPFSREAAKAGFRHLGGKIDDITVIVAQVVD